MSQMSEAGHADENSYLTSKLRQNIRLTNKKVLSLTIATTIHLITTLL